MTRWFRFSILALAAALAWPAPSGADDAQGLLARNRAFAGWSFGDTSMAGLRLTGSTGPNVEIVDLRRGTLAKRSVRNTSSGLAYAVGFTGNLFWYSNQNGFIVPLIGDAARYDVALAFVMNAGLPLLQGTLRSPVTIDGVSAQTVRLSVPNGYAVDASFDPASGKLLRAVIDPDGERDTLDILGYTALEGKQVITRWRFGKRTTEYSKVERATIADADFAPPAPTAHWTFGAPVPTPIRVTKDRIFVDASINGVKGRFILDTGAGSIALDAGYAGRLGLTELSTGSSQGISGSVRTGTARARTLEIGPHVLHDVIVTTGIHIQSSTESVDGLLGFDFLAGAIVDADLGKQQLTIFDPSKNDVTASGPVVIADLSDGSPVIPATIDGSVHAHVLLDSGNPMEVLLNAALSGPRGVTMRVEGETYMSGVSGDSRDLASCGHGQSLELGPVKYQSFPLCFIKSDALAADGGIIGFDFLRHFNITFDYPNSKLYLTPNGK